MQGCEQGIKTIGLETKMDKNTLAIVRESYGRCAMQATFFEDFYETFMRSSPEIMPFFDKTNMAKQRQLLRELRQCCTELRQKDE